MRTHNLGSIYVVGELAGYELRRAHWTKTNAKRNAERAAARAREAIYCRGELASAVWYRGAWRCESCGERVKVAPFSPLSP